MGLTETERKKQEEPSMRMPRDGQECETKKENEGRKHQSLSALERDADYTLSLMVTPR